MSLTALCDHEISSDVITGSESPIQGWYSEDHYEKCPAPALSFNVHQTACAFVVWVLYPMESTADATQVQASMLHDADLNQYAVRVKFGDREDIVKLAGDANRRTDTRHSVNSAIVVP